MTTEDLLRSGLHALADEVAPMPDLPVTALERGRRRRAVRRAAATGTVALCLAATGGAVAQTHRGDSRDVVRVSSAPPTECPAGRASGAGPWWDTWANLRQDGPLDNSLVAAASRYWHGTDQPPEHLCVYAAGATPDGTTWIMYTAPHAPHVMQWLQGLNGLDIDGHSDHGADPERTWSSFLAGSAAGPHLLKMVPQWLIVVGRPGTTQIDYSPDGNTWHSLDTHEGIAVAEIDQGWLSQAARVRLSDKNGVYAQGPPAGARSGVPDASPTPGESSAAATAAD